MKADINTIKENPHNPRTITEEKFRKLVKSLKEFPEMLEARPIVVDKDNIVLGGNMRLKAAREAGLTEVPIYQSEWSHDKSSEFIIKDNVGFGEWDWDMLGNEWDIYPLAEWGLDVWTPDLDPEELADGFNLADGDKPPFQSLTFTLSDAQAEYLKERLTEVKQDPAFQDMDAAENDNSNGNALSLLAQQWAEQKTSF